MFRFLITLALWIAVGCPGADAYREKPKAAHHERDGGSDAQP